MAERFAIDERSLDFILDLTLKAFKDAQVDTKIETGPEGTKITAKKSGTDFAVTYLIDRTGVTGPDANLYGKISSRKEHAAVLDIRCILGAVGLNHYDTRKGRYYYNPTRF